jgi:hypothetical protein
MDLRATAKAYREGWVGGKKKEKRKENKIKEE